LLGTATDITERKLTELDLVQQRNELAHLSRVMMLSELSGSLAHELNQPLAGDPQQCAGCIAFSVV
jgi:C4-dicarboxylate-specific signal transduction histidine kinase